MGRGLARGSDRGAGRSCRSGHRDRRSDRRSLPGRGVGWGRLGHGDGLPPRLAPAPTADSGAATGEPAAYTAVAAADATNALRQCAARVVAIEAASARTNRAGRRSDPAVVALVTRLDAGVAAHGRLVLMAADAVAASSGVADTWVLDRIEDETDRLRGLTLGLTELDPGA